MALNNDKRYVGQQFTQPGPVAPIEQQLTIYPNSPGVGMAETQPVAPVNNTPDRTSTFIPAKGIIDSISKLVSGRKSSSPKLTNPGVARYTSILPEDILMGRVTVDPNDEAYKAAVKINPTLEKARVDKESIDYQKLLTKAQAGDNGPGISPMAVSMLFQNSVNPFLNKVLEGSQQQTHNYQSIMNQMLSNTNLPDAYRNVLKAQVPQQVADMNMLTNATAVNTAMTPTISSLIDQLHKDYSAQQYLIQQQKLGQAAAGGTLFSNPTG